jgi:hypothetical protein
MFRAAQRPARKEEEPQQQTLVEKQSTPTTAPPAPQPRVPVEQQSAPTPSPTRRQTRKRKKSKSVKKQRATRRPNAVTVEDVAPAASPSKQEENEIAIKLASKELKKELKKGRELMRAELYDLLFGPENKRALPLRNKAWGTHWTLSRFRQKVWKGARARRTRGAFEGGTPTR